MHLWDGKELSLSLFCGLKCKMCLFEYNRIDSGATRTLVFLGEFWDWSSVEEYPTTYILIIVHE